MNYLILEQDNNAKFCTCLECYKNKFQKYLMNFRYEIEDLELFNITCPVDLINKYLAKDNRPNIFYKFNNSNNIKSQYYLKGCICRFNISNLIYKLIL